MNALCESCKHAVRRKADIIKCYHEPGEPQKGKIANVCLEFAVACYSLGVAKDFVVGSEEEIKEDFEQCWLLMLQKKNYN